MLLISLLLYTVSISISFFVLFNKGNVDVVDVDDDDDCAFFLIKHTEFTFKGLSKTIICVNLISNSKFLEENFIPSINNKGII